MVHQQEERRYIFQFWKRFWIDVIGIESVEAQQLEETKLQYSEEMCRT